LQAEQAAEKQYLEDLQSSAKVLEETRKKPSSKQKKPKKTRRRGEKK